MPDWKNLVDCLLVMLVLLLNVSRLLLLWWEKDPRQVLSVLLKLPLPKRWKHRLLLKLLSL
jgi:hypothetical protein